jgi:hypothetical protein
VDVGRWCEGAGGSLALTAAPSTFSSAANPPIPGGKTPITNRTMRLTAALEQTQWKMEEMTIRNVRAALETGCLCNTVPEQVGS